VSAVFVYSMNDYQSLISLPVPIAYPDAGAAETIGLIVRIADGDLDGRTRYTNSINVMEGNFVRHCVRFEVMPPVDSHFTSKTLELAASFSRRAVIKKQEISCGTNP